MPDGVDRPSLHSAPRAVVAAAEHIMGSTVAHERRADLGFTHAVASWIRAAAGRMVFVKAAPTDTPAGSGVRIGAELAPVIGDLGPQLLGYHEVDGWVVAVYEAISGSALSSWDASAAQAMADLSHRLRTRLDPSPVGDTDSYAEAFAPLLGTWAALSAPDHPRAATVAHLTDRPLPYGLDVGQLAALEAQWFGVLSQESTALQHGDLRRDNVIRDGSGRLWLVDWTHRWVAPGWVDIVRVAPDIAACGFDPEAFLHASAWNDAPPERVNVLLAGLASRAWRDGHLPDVESIPQLRAMQREQADMILRWLAARLAK